MPEGHKTHFIAREHSGLLLGQKLKVTSPQGRFSSDAKKISQRALESVAAAGKRLFYEFEGDRFLHIHLGRYGKFRQLPTPPPPPVGQVRVRLQGSGATIDLNGPTTCVVIGREEKDELVAALGPDPLAGGKKADAWKLVRASNKPIGGLLLDQSVIAGVGNIFRAEVLFEIGLDPRIRGSDLSADQFDAVWKSLSKMMKTGLKYGRIISVTAKEAGVPLAKVPSKDRFRIYAKKRCPRCNGSIGTIEIASRKLYVCESCQGMD